MATQTGSYDFKAAKAVQTNLDNMEVGGSNLLLGTGDWSKWYNEQNEWELNGETATSPVKSSLQWAALDSTGIPLTDCYGKTFTLSFEYRSDSWSSSSGTPYVYVNAKTQLVEESTGPRKKYRRIDASKFTPTTAWQKAIITFTVGSDESWFTSGTAGGSYMAFQIFNYTLNQLQLRRPKLEYGNVPTDWTPAPEDVDDSVYQSSQPNLSPYYASVPYSSTNTYWKSIQTGNGFTFTSMGDGWMRVQCTNSGSSVIRRDWYPVKCPSVVPGGNYTWLVEIRNNNSTSVSSGSDFYLVQTNNCQFWGQKATQTIEGPSGSSMSVNIGTCGSTYTLRKVQKAETSSGGHWTDNLESNVVGLACWTTRCAANSSIDYEVRLSLYEGRYTGPYKPYVGELLYASQTDVAEAAAVAGNYIWESALNDMWLHSEDHGPDTDPNSQTYGQATADTYGWRIGSVFELVRAGLSYFKMWVENSVAKVRVGVVQAGHAIFSPDGMEVFDYDSTLSEPAAVSVAQFGKSGARVGTSGGKHVDVDSDGMVVKNNTTELAKIGSSGFHIGKADTYTSNYFSVDSNGNGIFQGAKLVVRDSPYDPANDLASCTIKHHYVKVGGFDQNGLNFHAVSLYASSDSARIGLWDEVGSKWVLNYLANKVTIPNTLAFENGTTQWDNSQGITHLQTPVASSKQAEFTFEPDGRFYHRTSADGGSSWGDYAAVGEVSEVDVDTAVSVATATYKSIASVSLKPGKWLIAYGGQFASNSTGYRAVFLYTTQNAAGSAAWYRASLVQGPAANGAGTYLRGACAVELASTTTVYLTLYHTRGSALNCYGNIRAMRVW